MQGVAWCPLCRQMEKWRCAQRSSGGKKARDLCPLGLLLLLLMGVKLLSPVSAKKSHKSSVNQSSFDWNRLGAIQRSCYPHQMRTQQLLQSTSISSSSRIWKKKENQTQTHISITLVLLLFHVERSFEYQCLGWKECMRKLVLLQPAWYSFQTRLCSLWSQLQSSMGLTKV